MITDIFVDTKRLDLYSETDIKFTMQTNDIAEVKDRQASFTNSFSIPKTANNIQILNGLGISSDTSKFPYTKPNCQIKLDGFDLIVKGFINITETDDEYKIYVYSGIITFFKAIGNKNLGEALDLTELDHVKNLTNVIASFTNEFYKYLITDYNGKTHYGTTSEIINIDYLVPSIKVKYLWDKIHETFGFTYSGLIFTKDEFLNLSVTYPKPIELNLLDLIIEGDGGFFIGTIANTGNEDTYYQTIYVKQDDNIIDFTITESANYKITLSANNNFEAAIHQNIKYFLSINQENIRFSERLNPILLKEISTLISDFEVSRTIYLNAGDVISIYDYLRVNGEINWNSSYNVKIEKLKNANVSFNSELSQFSITDFVKEVINQFGLTIISNELNNNLKYLTISEIINNNSLDWTGKYVKRVKENYVYQSYAQKNIFSYQYNDKESDYHDGSLGINNINIQESKSVFKSKMYSPEKQLTEFFLGTAGNVFLRLFKMYDKDIKENSGVTEINYKPLDKRFHFVREQILITDATLGSEIYAETQTVSSLPLASFDKLDWQTLLRKNYTKFGRILNDARIHNIHLNLSFIDLLNLDFSKLYYFAQEQQYYILNKLIYGENESKAEFVRVKNYNEESIVIDPENPDFILTISFYDNTNLPKTGQLESISIKISAISYPSSDKLLIFDWEKFDGTNWISLGNGISPYTATLLEGENKFRLKSTSETAIIVYSNQLLYNQVIINCRSYHVFGRDGSGEEVYVKYIDCEGVSQEYHQYSTGPGDKMDFFFCAQDGSVEAFSSGVTIEDLGTC